nr:hypothetical protein GCM10020241_61600 [Streptoalloteichus tenebrarius]
MRERAHDAAGAAVRDHRRAAGEDRRLRDEPFDVDVGGLGAELGGVEVPADGHDEVDGQLAQAGDRAGEQVAALHVEDRAEGEVDGRGVRQVVQPGRRRGALVEDVWAQRVRRRGQWVRGVAETGRERGQHEVPLQHREVGVGRQAVLGAQRVQRLGDQLGPHERSRGDDEHPGVGDAEAFGGDQGSEVHLLADQEVRPPLLAEREQGGGPPAGPVAGEVLPDHPVLPLPVHLQQGKAFRCSLASDAGGEDGEARLPHRRRHRGLRREGDGVASGLGGARDRRERREVPGAADEGEEDAHGAVPFRPGDDLPSFRTIHLRAVGGDVSPRPRRDRLRAGLLVDVRQTAGVAGLG